MCFQVLTEVVEIDPAMLSIASEWFGFNQDERMKVVVADGLAHIKQLSQSGRQCHRYSILV